LPNKILKRPYYIFPGDPKFDLKFDETGVDNIFRLGTNWDKTHFEGATRRMRQAPSNAYLIRQKVSPLAINKTYTLSFDVKGARVLKSNALLVYRAFEKSGEDREVRGERGSVKKIKAGGINGQQMELVNFTASGNWTTFSKDLRISFSKPEHRDANKLAATSEAVLEIYCELSPPDGVLYIDNIKLEPKAD
jgi:hypothetical protein